MLTPIYTNMLKRVKHNFENNERIDVTDMHLFMKLCFTADLDDLATNSDFQDIARFVHASYAYNDVDNNPNFELGALYAISTCTFI